MTVENETWGIGSSTGMVHNLVGVDEHGWKTRCGDHVPRHSEVLDGPANTVVFGYVMCESCQTILKGLYKLS